MKNFVQPGDVQTFTAPMGGVVSGGVYQIGQVIVVAGADVVAGLTFEGKVRGVFSVTKTGSQAWTEGALVYFTGTEFTTSSSGNRLAGHAAAAVGSGSGETTGLVYLDGTSRVDS